VETRHQSRTYIASYSSPLEYTEALHRALADTKTKLRDLQEYAHMLEKENTQLRAESTRPI
jgi:hypothetical protein